MLTRKGSNFQNGLNNAVYGFYANRLYDMRFQESGEIMTMAEIISFTLNTYSNNRS